MYLYLDLYGKGYSETQSVAYDANLFTIQLALLMQYVKWQKATIIGFSMVGPTQSIQWYPMAQF